jgi:hypothetical protein
MLAFAITLMIDVLLVWMRWEVFRRTESVVRLVSLWSLDPAYGGCWSTRWRKVMRVNNEVYWQQCYHLTNIGILGGISYLYMHQIPIFLMRLLLLEIMHKLCTYWISISRLFASGLDGAVYMWDRRLSKTHCIELTALPESQFTSVKLNMDNQVC